MKKYPKSILVTLCIAGLFCVISACNNKKTFEKYNNLPALTWEQSNISKYTLTLSENAPKASKMGIGFRVVPSIAHKSVPVQLLIKPKNEKSFIKNYEIVLKDDNGKIKGGVMGDLADVEQILADDFPFKEKGEYQIEIQHLNSTTQDKKLLGIMEVGFFLSKE